MRAFLLVFLAACAAVDTPAEAPAVPVLDVTFPAAGGPTIEAVFKLKSFGMGEGAYRYSAFRVRIGDARPVVVEPDEEVTLRVAVPADGVLRFRVGDEPVLAAAAAGDRLRFGTHPLGGEWDADVWSSAPWNPALERCVAQSDDCTDDEVDEPAGVGEPGCDGETHRFCVQAPRMRLRGPSGEDVRTAGAHDAEPHRLVPDGASVPLHLHHCRLPFVSFGDETVVVLAGYGEEWTVFRAGDGTISASVAAMPR